MANCSKEEISNEGVLSVKFSNVPSDLSVYIFTTENTDFPIYSNIKPDADGLIEMGLNFGNYIISPYSASGTVFTNNGFQIKSNKTTSIVYDSNNIGHLQE